MRVGTNPNRQAVVPSFAPVAIGVVTHLPDDKSSYHSKRLEVVQACLTTIREGCKLDHTLIVWDNGSSATLRNWLQDKYKPDMLMLSANIGKSNARKAMAEMTPPDSVFCFSDDDIYYYDDWLRPQIELLQHFPNVSCVSGYPVRTSFRWGNQNTIAWAKAHAKLEFGRFIPQEWDDDFAVSVGRTLEFQREYAANDKEALITYNNKQAYATAHHCQFIGYAGTIAKACRYDNDAMGDEKPLDLALDKLGLRLATTNRLARHIGNVLDDKIKSLH